MMETQNKNLMVEHRIPVVYQMRGYARVKLPINASEDDITAALEDIDPEEMEDAELYAPGGWSEEMWKPEVPDLDVLRSIGEAFQKLDEKHNIATLSNQCCNTDSSYAAHELLEEQPRYIGFAYIHTQNVGNLAEGGNAFVGYGAREDNDEEHAHIGRMVVAALEDCGLTIVEWDGDADSKIEVASTL